jgi:uncharacterized protein (DUF58 family)
MKTLVSPKVAAYAAVGLGAVVAGIVLGRAEVAVIGIPFLVYLVFALALVRPVDVTVSLTLARERVLEDDEVNATLELTSAAGVPEVDVALVLPAGAGAVDEVPRFVVRVERDVPRRVGVRLAASHWGAYRLGGGVLRARDGFGVVVREAELEPAAALRVYPRPERLLALVAPADTQPFSGDRVSRAKGDGIEFADVREFRPGDRIRRVNWRATARQRELMVNAEHPERNSDVVLFLDGLASGPELLDRTVHAAAQLARGYLDRHDRVGVIGFGGALHSLVPGLGARQLYRIVETLVDAEFARGLVSLRVADPYATVATALEGSWTAAELLPPRSLPPQALVLALTPLLDERAARTLLDIRARGFDLAIVELSPLPFAPPPEDRVDELARRLWALRRDVLRFRFEQLGVVLTAWRDDRPLAAVIEEVNASRRSVHRLSA